MKKVNINRVKHWFSQIEKINSGTTGCTRSAFSPEEKQVKAWLVEELEKLGVQARYDQAQNVIARFGSQSGPAIVIGSHLDTVPEGGLFDGALGVLAGLEVITVLAENNENLPVPVELICFTGEEANPLGGTFGSRAMAGLISYTEEYEQKLNAFGFTWQDILNTKRQPEEMLSFLELHIEQGAVLESNNEKVGIVTSIAGMNRFEVKLKGKAAHSGTTPMDIRNDALVEAAKVILQVSELGFKYKDGVVTTTGEISVFPNMANVVPGEASLLVEVRSGSFTKMSEVKNELWSWINQYIPSAEIKPIVEKAPGNMSSFLQSKIEQSCEALNIPCRYMVSGANHDANSISHIANTGMLFVPSKNGISHHPDEYTSWTDIETGIEVLLETVQQLASEYAKPVYR